MVPHGDAAAKQRLVAVGLAAVGTVLSLASLFGPWWTRSGWSPDDPSRGSWVTDMGLMDARSWHEPESEGILDTAYGYWHEERLGPLFLVARTMVGSALVLAFSYVLLEASRPSYARLRRFLPKLPAIAALLMFAALVEVTLFLPDAITEDLGRSVLRQTFWGANFSNPGWVWAWGAGWGWYAALGGAVVLACVSLLRAKWWREVPSADQAGEWPRYDAVLTK